MESTGCGISTYMVFKLFFNFKLDGFGTQEEEKD